MKIEVKIDKNIIEPVIEIHSSEITEEISKILKQLENINESKIIGWKENKAYILELEEIDTIYSNNGKVYVISNGIEYVSKNKLYEFEEQINLQNFIRISNSEIVNFKKVESLDLNILGTIKLKLKNGYSTYVSRRNIKKIKEYLKI